MQTIKARDLLATSTAVLWDTLPKEQLTLVFDNGEEYVCNWKSTIISSYGWDFHREYPNTPLLKKHHVGKLIEGKRFTPNTHLELLGNIVWDVYDAYPTIDRDILAKSTYQKTNELYNELSVKLEEYVSSIDILDFIQVLNSPVVEAANDNVKPTAESIDETYSIIKNALSQDPVLFNNPLAKAGRAGIVNSGQLMQCVGPRGFITDTNSRQFKTPVLRGYAEGLRLFYDHFIESRSAAKSLEFSKKPLQDTEYFARRLQLLDQIVKRLHHGDCGSTEYLRWTIRGPAFNEKGREIFSGDLGRLVGKFYLDEETKQLKAIHKSDKHLIGKTILLRTVLECQHPDPYGICSTCFGELSLSVPANTNIGHMCCTSMTQKSSQSVLSTKHLDTSAVIEPIVIEHHDLKYLQTDNEGMSYFLNEKLKGEISLVISAKEAFNISDIMEVKVIESLNIAQISQVTQIGFRVTTEKEFEQLAIQVGSERRKTSMTYPFLKYVKENGWHTDDNGNYVINMDKWDRSLPMLSLPLIHYSMSEHASDISKLLESTVSELEKRDKATSASSILYELYGLVNNKLNVNLAILEVVLYGIMIQSATDYRYHLPKPNTDRGIGVRSAIMSYRSLSAAMAYEDHKEILTNPLTFLLTERPDHPLDHLLMPNEAIE